MRLSVQDLLLVDGEFSIDDARIFAGAILAKRPTVMVEIGCWMGRSSLIAGTLLREWGGHLFCIDSFKLDSKNEDRHPKEIFEEAIKERKLEDVITIIEGKSEDVIDQIPEMSFAHIDGDHSYLGVKTDFEIIDPKLEWGGIILFHDAQEHFKGVWQLMEEIGEKEDYVVQCEMRYPHINTSLAVALKF